VDGSTGVRVSLKFFGQFLIERGEIDAGQLREALERMQERNLSLGDLAIAAGLLSPEDAARLNAAQLEVDRPFGELAVEKGLLSRELLDRLLRHQSETRLPIGEALVALGHLPATRLGALLDQFKIEQSPFASGDRPLPRELVGVRVAALALDQLPRFCMRVARLHVKLAPARAHSADARLKQRAMLVVRGPQSLEIGLAADGEVVSALAAGICGPASRGFDAASSSDVLGYFLSLLVGNAIAALEREGIFARVEPVRSGSLPAGGHAFDWIATVGRGVLVVSPSALG
jgi:hypothetical protein